ncbi:MAG TPA: tetratricopeptide repeat protein [Kofleriaceae bacterium]
MRTSKLLGAVCVMLLVPVLAWAQPRTPEDFYKEGETQYNLGEFQKAIEAFKKGFELETSESKKSAYLYNIAQSYRQAKDCSNAQFFYKRYLALKENDTVKPLKPEKRTEIEERIKELEECARQQEAIRQKPPDQNPEDDPSKKPPDTQVAVKPPPEEEEPAIVETSDGTPRVISIRALGGGAKLTTGDLDVPIQATLALIGGYPLKVQDKVTLELGAGFTFTPVPYEAAETMESKSANLIAVIANVGATYHVAPKFGLRGDLGVGVLLFTGVSESPFTANAPVEGGALSMLHVRVGISADYAITPNVIATVAPIAFSYSPPKEGLDEDITAITALDFMVGLGYRM